MKLLICILVSMMAAPLAMSQTLAPPPFKMGLWETRSTARMTGFQLPPEVVARLQAAGQPLPGSQPIQSTVRMCMTPRSWKNQFEDLQPNKECPMKILKQDAAGMSADFACKPTAPGDQRSGHIEITYANPQKWSGTMRTQIITASHPAPMVMNAVFDSVYLGADCQGIAPGASKTVP